MILVVVSAKHTSDISNRLAMALSEEEGSLLLNGIPFNMMREHDVEILRTLSEEKKVILALDQETLVHRESEVLTWLGNLVKRSNRTYFLIYPMGDSFLNGAAF